jgi:Protein of unknown function (DUF2934)
MAKTRKSEPDVMVSAAAAAPARSRAVTAPRKPRPAATKTPAAMVESVAAPYSPAQEEIAALAYSFWVTRGYQGGSPEEDWLRAEQELHQRTS